MIPSSQAHTGSDAEGLSKTNFTKCYRWSGTASNRINKSKRVKWFIKTLHDS